MSASTTTYLDRMDISKMSDKELKAELARRFLLATVNGAPIEIEGTREDLEKILIHAREKQHQGAVLTSA